MSFSPPNRPLARLWALLFVAFLVVGLSAGIATLHLALDQYTTDLRTDLLNTARLMAMAVDSTEHQKLQKQSDMQGPVYKHLVDRLGLAQRQASDIRYVHTIRRQADGSFVFILDPSVAGDHDRDGLDDKRYLLAPYPEISSYAKKCYDSGEPVVEPTFLSDRWGKFWSAYAPLIGGDGKVVGILAVEKDASSVQAHIVDLYRIGGLGLALVVGLAFIFALGIAKQLNGVFPLGEAGSTLRTSRSVRVAVFELLLAGLALSVMVIGLNSYINRDRLIKEREEWTQRQTHLRELERGFSLLGFQESADKDELKHLKQLAAKLNLGWVASMATDVQTAGPHEWRREVKDISTQLAQEVDRAERTREALRTKILGEDQMIRLAFFVAIGLGLASLMLVRIAVQHHQHLVSTLDESEELKAANRQITDHLPIGLFMIRKGEIVFSNPTWDKQVLRRLRDGRQEAFTRSLHPEDRDAVLSSLFAERMSGEIIDLKYRIVHNADEARAMESRAVPVRNSDGELDHILGFVIDVTDRIAAEQGLLLKQGEAEAKNVMLEAALRDLEENFQQMVYGLVKAVEAKDPYTAGHSERVMGYSVRIGEALCLPSKDLKILELGTLIHDVGKIGIPDDILLKPDRLTQAEFEIVRTHPTLGAEMVEKIPLFTPCIPIIRWHHERLTGDGYPDGLSGAAIPRMVRIAMVADAFDAMTSSRAYRGALDSEKALAELREEAASGGLDLEIVEILADIVKRDGILWVPPLEQAA